jgi:hypothetical protein
MSTATVVRIAHRFYESRDTLRSLFPESYGERIAEHRRNVRQLAVAYNCELVAVPLEMAKRVRADGEQVPAVLLMWLLAAIVEEVEG